MSAAFDLLIGAEDADELAGLQELADTGAAWRLEGSVGRAVMDAIEAGQIALGETGHFDYWGNYVPSRYEVEPGTKGSVEYVEAHGGRVPPKPTPQPERYEDSTSPYSRYEED